MLGGVCRCMARSTLDLRPTQNRMHKGREHERNDRSKGRDVEKDNVLPFGVVGQ